MKYLFLLLALGCGSPDVCSTLFTTTNTEFINTFSVRRGDYVKAGSFAEDVTINGCVFTKTSYVFDNPDSYNGVLQFIKLELGGTRESPVSPAKCGMFESYIYATFKCKKDK